MAQLRYTEEFKERACVLYAELQSSKKVAAILGCSHYAVQQWVKQATKKSAPIPNNRQTDGINPLLLKMANGNDLTPFIGKDITKMQPREIWDFLRAINVKGDIIIEQRIKLCQ